MPTRTPQSTGRAHGAVHAAVTHGALAALATALTDFAGTGSFAGWSPARFATYLGVHLGVGTVVAAAVASLHELGARLASSPRLDGAPRARAWLAPGVLVLAATVPAVAFAVTLFSGASASRLPFRSALVAITALTLLAGLHAAALAVRALARPPATRRGRLARWAAAAALTVAASALAFANQHALPNLYPAVHALVALATFGAFATASVAANAAARKGPAERLSAGKGTAALGFGAIAALVATLAVVERSPVLRLALFDPRAAISQAAMRGIDPLASRFARHGGSRARAAASASVPVDAIGGPVRPSAHVLLVTVDALRADHLGTYGYARPTSPALDAFAAESVVFEHAYAQAPHSSYSLCSLMASEYLHDTLDLGLPLPETTLPLALRERGYHTAGIYTRGIFHTDGDRVRAYDERHFDLVHHDHRSLDADARTDAAIAEIDRIASHGEPPSFLWVHYFDTHEPYRRTEFGTRDMDRYDSEILQVDAEVTRLVREARARLTRDVVVVLTADHGEEFRDHGGLYHGTSVYEEQIHVPLIVSAPGVAPRRVVAPVELVDVAPTLLRLVGAEVPATMRGDDLRGVMVGSGDAPRAAVSAVLSKRAIVAWPYKLVQDTRFRLVELFDLSRDPRERTNLAAAEPDRVAELESEVATFLDGLGQPARSAPDPTLLAMRRARLQDRRAVAPLVTVALDDSAPADTRREAARLLGSLRDPSARDALASLLDEGDEGIADEAAIALAALLDPRGKRRLARAALEGDDEGLRFRAAVALGTLGDPRAVPPLVDALVDGEDVRERRLAAQTLGDLRDPRAVDALIGAMSEFRLRSSAAVALGKIGDPRAFEPIVASLETDRHVMLRDAMARALSDLGDPRALPILLAMASDEPELMNATRGAIRLGALARGVAGGVSLWGRERPLPRPLCKPTRRNPCADDVRAIELSLRVPPALLSTPAQAVLRARVGRGQTVTLAWEIGGVPLAPVTLDGEAREHRVAVPREALTSPRAGARLLVDGDAELVVDHLLLLPLRPGSGA